MALSAFWLEDFIEWAAAVNVATPPGTGWADTTGPCTVQADANFASGKALRWTNTQAGGSTYTFGVVPVGSLVVSWNAIRTSNASVEPTDGDTSGWQFQTGVANTWFRIVPGNGGTGLGNTYYLQRRSGASGTFTTLYQSENIYPTGAKINFAFGFDSATGAVEFYINGSLVYSGVSAPFIGLNVIAMYLGRQGTGVSSSIHFSGDFFGYTGATYVGPVEIRSGFPTANSALQDWTAIGGSPAWDSLNNSIVAAPTEYIESAVSGNISDFEAPVNNTNVFAIWAAEVRYYATRTDVSLVDMNGRIGDGISFTNGSTTNPPQASYQFFRDRYAQINPNTGLAWTTGDMAAAEIGVRRTS